MRKAMGLCQPLGPNPWYPCLQESSSIVFHSFPHLQSSPLFAQKAQAAQLLQRIAIEPPHVGCDDPRLRLTKSESTRSQQEQQKCHGFAWGSPNSLSLSSAVSFKGKAFLGFFYILMFRLYHLLIDQVAKKSHTRKIRATTAIALEYKKLAVISWQPNKWKKAKFVNSLAFFFFTRGHPFLEPFPVSDIKK